MENDCTDGYIYYPVMPKEEYSTIMAEWDNIRKMLLVDREMGSLPRDLFETIIDDVYTMGYLKGKGVE